MSERHGRKPKEAVKNMATEEVVESRSFSIARRRAPRPPSSSTTIRAVRFALAAKPPDWDSPRLFVDRFRLEGATRAA